MLVLRYTTDSKITYKTKFYKIFLKKDGIQIQVRILVNRETNVILYKAQMNPSATPPVRDCSFETRLFFRDDDYEGQLQMTSTPVFT